ncbi:MAG: hypothetical protein H0X31_01040, partial [Nostocaceae cyanobacterium]|nr:hypothetical protein [Nostocaceae cyanobacterium]
QALGIDTIYNSTQGGPGGTVNVFTQLNVQGQRIVNIADPINPQDAMTLAYAGSTYIPLSQKAAALGVATLDSAGKVPVNQLPNSVMELQGVWNASTNTPTLADGTGNIGDVYLVSVAGTANLGSGAQTFVVKDWVVYNSSGIWQKAHAGADSVLSVNGFAGVVNLTTTDVPEGTNLYFTNARAKAAVPAVGTAGAIQFSDGASNFTADSTNLTFDNSTKILTVSPGVNGTAAKIGNGAFVSGFNGDGFLGAGATINNGAWVATQTSHANSYFQAAGGAGQYNIFTDTGLTPGVGFNPNLRFSIGPTGKADIYTGLLDMHSHKIQNVTNPTNPQDVATKNYVDNATPTGTANTVAFFNGSGALSNDTTLRYFIATDSMTMGSGPLSVAGSAGSSLVRGISTGSSNMIATGAGAMVSGQHFNNNFANAMSASGTGAHVLGAANDGQMYATNVGSIALGAAYAGSSGSPIIQSTGAGSIAAGLAVSNGVMTSSGSGSFAFGLSHGNNSSGTEVTASGDGSLAGGYAFGTQNTIASGKGAVSIGRDINTSSDFGQTFGIGHINNTYLTHVVGRYSVTPTSNPTTFTSTDPAFVVGNGSGTGSRSNAFQVDKDGRLTTTGAQIRPFRVVTSATTLSARTDHKVICDQASGGAFTLTLPAGVQGLNYMIGQSAANTATVTIATTGADTLDVNIQAIFNSNAPVSVTYNASTTKWYAI